MCTRNEFTYIEREFKIRRERAVPEQVMLFLSLNFLRYGDEGGAGVMKISHTFGLRISTVSNYVRRVGSALLDSLLT